MRPIEFRGISTATNKMVFGSLIVQSSTIIDKEGTEHKVIPETIGQFTGRLDKNGKKIFEGDVYTTNYKYIPNLNYAVYFTDGAFCGGQGENSLAPLFWETDENEDLTIVDEYNWEIQVIGNIHENPELLK